MADAVMALILVLAILWGMRRGLVQPLLSELSFVIALVVASRFHTQVERLLPRGVPAWAGSALLVIAITFGLGLATRPLIRVLRGVPVIGALDRSAGAVVHFVFAFMLIYLAIGALLDFDARVYPMIQTGLVTAQQVHDYRQLVDRNPLAGSASDKRKLADAEAAARQKPIPIDAFQQLESFLNFYIHDVREPMSQSRLGPVINSIGGQVPILGHRRPYLFAGLTATPTAGPIGGAINWRTT